MIKKKKVKLGMQEMKGLKKIETKAFDNSYKRCFSANALIERK